MLLFIFLFIVYYYSGKDLCPNGIQYPQPIKDLKPDDFLYAGKLVFGGNKVYGFLTATFSGIIPINIDISHYQIAEDLDGCSKPRGSIYIDNWVVLKV